ILWGFWLLDRREEKRQREERPQPRITVEPPERMETAPLLCESRSASGSRCGRSPGHTGLHGCVEIMRDGERAWPSAVYWADMIHVPAPRGLDPVTVDDGRVVTERV